MMIAHRRWLAALAFVLTASCRRHGAAEQQMPLPPRNPNVISEFELRAPQIIPMDALKAIRTLRPAFFRPVGPMSFVNANAGEVHYSMDFGPLRPISELATLNTAMLVEIRYLDLLEAQNRFGVNANGGPVIVLLNNRVP